MIVDLLIPFVLVVVGLLVLLTAGDWLVRGAADLAVKAKVPTLIVGLTIVAFGTSAPELVVSLQAVLGGNAGIAVGNIVGSNIANILLVLGFPAIGAAIALNAPGLRWHTLVMLFATGAWCYIVYVTGALNPTWGAAFLGLIAVYVFSMGITALRASPDTAGALSDELAELVDEEIKLSKIAVLIILGIVGLIAGGWLMVTYGAKLARLLSVREEIIGLTIVAFGTSLPELATVWAATRNNKASVAVGNVVGSNIFNILFVGGAAGLAGTTAFSSDARLIDVPVMVAAALIFAVLALSKRTLTWPIGLLFAAGYLGYVIIISLFALDAGALSAIEAK